MGGNAKYKGARMRTATYNETDGTRKAVTDSNGNIIRVGVGPQVGRDKRTNTAISNARERMLNAKAIQDVRDTAKQYQKLSKSLSARERKIGISDFDYASFNKDLGESVRLAKKLGNMANQVQPGTIYNVNAISPREIRTIEQVLGVKLT